MTTLEPPEDFVGRDPIFGPLKRAFEEMDPVPDGLAERVLVALALEDLELEYELLTMVHRSAQLSGIRSTTEKTMIEFSSAGLTVMLRVGPSDPQHCRIDGWVSPAQPLTAVLWQGKSAVRGDVSAQGRFEFPSVPRGLTRLELLPADGSTGPAPTFRTTLFEI